jgi:hypothetical protein
MGLFVSEQFCFTLPISFHHCLIFNLSGAATVDLTSEIKLSAYFSLVQNTLVYYTVCMDDWKPTEIGVHDRQLWEHTVRDV